jgi:hypothetical protein
MIAQISLVALDRLFGEAASRWLIVITRRLIEISPAWAMENCDSVRSIPKSHRIVFDRYVVILGFWFEEHYDRTFSSSTVQ